MAEGEVSSMAGKAGRRHVNGIKTHLRTEVGMAITGRGCIAAGVGVHWCRLLAFLRRRARHLIMPAFLLFLAPVLPAGGAFPPVRMVWQVVVVRVIGWCIVSRRRCEAVAWAVQLGDLVLHGGGGSERWWAGEALRGGGEGGGGAGYVIEESDGAVLQRVLLDDLLNELEPEENGWDTGVGKI
jgi:hypothetical protein